MYRTCTMYLIKLTCTLSIENYDFICNYTSYYSNPINFAKAQFIMRLFVEVCIIDSFDYKYAGDLFIFIVMQVLATK